MRIIKQIVNVQVEKFLRQPSAAFLKLVEGLFS